MVCRSTLPRGMVASVMRRLHDHHCRSAKRISRSCLSVTLEVGLLRSTTIAKPSHRTRRAMEATDCAGEAPPCAVLPVEIPVAKKRTTTQAAFILVSERYLQES